ncbi:L-asparagine transporter [Caldanaerobius fijiensis DSM 17918]|uniref:L-asparagine transporter n=1 Tax=Caldanaerobius fijiensis DSM 17918 TaxID=1121256 RepID=A0A1M4SC20_9THEO|nr:amino acid permease [Caldanaerobius fijiensis]SHE29675.1 L-asparagine transporter [Caldanaerobius fijiensis DSM 17918]
MERGKISTNKLTMLSVGGIIGAGFFLASGIAIKEAGPAILINTLISVFLMYTVFQALVEMITAQPVAGSFRVYAQEVLGNRYGFMSGWLYWVAGVLVMSSEVTASAIFTRYWFPAIPLWVFTLMYSVLIVGVNLMGIEDFSLIESIFSVIKVLALMFIIIAGIVLLIMLSPKRPDIGFENYVKFGGFFPNGIKGMYGAMLMSLLSFAGIEVTAMAANQARSERTIKNTLRNVIALLTILYTGSFVVLLALTPWKLISVKISPFVKLFDFVKIPYADSILNFIILTAALTTMNAAMYAVTQVLFSLGQGEFAPTLLAKENKRGIPIYALMATSMGLIIAITLSYILPKAVYEYITSSAGIIQFSNWIIILLTHIKFRKYIDKKGMKDKLTFKAKGYPLLSWIGLIGVLLVILSSLVVPKERIGFIVGIVIILFLFIFYSVAKRINLFERW